MIPLVPRAACGTDLTASPLGVLAFHRRSASASPAFLSGDEASPPASPLRHDNHSPLEKSTMWRENFKNHSAARESVRMAGMLLSQGVGLPPHVTVVATRCWSRPASPHANSLTAHALLSLL